MRFLDDYLDTIQPSLSHQVEPTPRATAPDGAIARPDRETLEAHLARRHYGPFTLTDAIRPGWQLDVVPRAGYRHDAYVDPRSGQRLPALVAAVSSEQLFDTFLRLIEPLGDTLDVVLDTTHDDTQGGDGFTREGIERLVLESVLWDFEDLLLDDGCTGVAVMHPELQVEVQLDPHKLLVVYAQQRGPFERILAEQGIERNDSIRFISQAEHLHTSHTRFARRFDELVARLGAGE
ncbi:MAG: hypothetical protein RLZZ111_197 [Planctomycetota bacterium]|jgi:hypothetical protein